MAFDQENRDDDALESALTQEETRLMRLLERSPEYVRLEIVRTALRSLRSAKPQAVMAVAKSAVTDAPSLAPHGGGTSFTMIFPTSNTGAAKLAIEKANHPLTTSQLLDALTAYGRTLNSKKPLWALSNSLSSDKRFRSVPWRGARAWWLPALGEPPHET